MESVLGRYRNLIVLVGVLFVQVLGLAVQVKRTTDSEPTRLIRIWAVGAVSPLEKVLNWVQTSTSNVWHNYCYLRGVRAENRALKGEIDRIRLEEARLNQDADQAHRLQALLGFKQQFISKTLAAQVIGSSGSEQSRSVYIDKGEKSGLKPDMAVITADGIVGKVLRVYRSTSLVLLINDQSSGVGGILEKSRLQGILRGTPGGEVALEKVMSDEAVPVGELVLTSGGDRIFPKGLVVGRVTKVSTGNDLFLNIRVKPAANLGRLEEVLVVTKIDERQSEPEENGSTRAADILAARLPSVPAKPPETPAAGIPTDATAAGQPPRAGTQATKPNVGNNASPMMKPMDNAKPKTEAPATGTGTPTTKKLRPAGADSGAQTAKKPAPPTSAAADHATEKPVKSTVETKPPVEDTPH
jgi:rod shape-determining protein MreC